MSDRSQGTGQTADPTAGVGRVAGAGRAGGGTDEGWGVADLRVRYGRHLAVDGVTVTVRPHGITALVGGDGAGKSTTLKALVGAVGGAASSIRRPDARRIGYVSPGPGVYTDLTVAENLAFSARVYGLAGQVARERTAELLARTGLADVTGRLTGNLSGGMRQKLALACALLPAPDLLVLDEPTTGVDPVSRIELWRLIARSAADGAAVLLATTYLDEAERAGTIVVLDAGRQVLAGPPGDVIDGIPGAVLETDARPATQHAWRLGRRWRLWSPDGTVPDGTVPARPRLEDAVIVATLRAGARGEGDE